MSRQAFPSNTQRAVETICAKIHYMAVRIVFMGSPDFALPTLEYLHKKHTLCGIVTQPDRPAGRGRGITQSAVRLKAVELGLPCIQPEKLREASALETLQAWNPDLIVVAAYGQILRKNVLDLPKYGCLNVHASLLPRWRGASPIQFAILSGDACTGISVMKMDAGLDTGPVLSQAEEVIGPTDTASSLGERLAILGAAELARTLPRYLDGEIQPQPQDESAATHARMLKKEDGLLDLNRPAGELVRQVYAFNPWPGAYTIWVGQPLKILAARADETMATEPGQRSSRGRTPVLGTGKGVLLLDEVQPAGKKPMAGSVFLSGARSWLDQK